MPEASDAFAENGTTLSCKVRTKLAKRVCTDLRRHGPARTCMHLFLGSDKNLHGIKIAWNYPNPHWRVELVWFLKLSEIVRLGHICMGATSLLGLKCHSTVAITRDSFDQFYPAHWPQNKKCNGDKSVWHRPIHHSRLSTYLIFEVDVPARFSSVHK